MAREGHEIGSHTFDHRLFTDLKSREIIDQMRITESLIREVTGKKPRFMRAPEGRLTKKSIRIITRKLKYRIVHWNLDSEDWKFQDKNHAFSHTVEAFKNACETSHGLVLLQHDTIENTAKVLADTIDAIREAGRVIVPLRECLGLASPKKREFK